METTADEWQPEQAPSLHSVVVDTGHRPVQVLVDATAAPDPEQSAALTTAALPFVLRPTVAKLKREVSVTPAQEGMAWHGVAWLTAYPPAADALGIDHRDTDIAGDWACANDTCHDNPAHLDVATRPLIRHRAGHRHAGVSRPLAAPGCHTAHCR